LCQLSGDQRKVFDVVAEEVAQSDKDSDLLEGAGFFEISQGLDFVLSGQDAVWGKREA
jgi:hypothetical protein